MVPTLKNFLEGGTRDQRAASQATGRSQLLTEASSGQAVISKALISTTFLPGEFSPVSSDYGNIGNIANNSVPMQLPSKRTFCSHTHSRAF